MSSLLPNAERGYLPYFLLYEALAAMIHSVFCYLSRPSTAVASFRGPNAPPPTALLAHTYAVKNIYTGAIRLYAAYAIGAEQQNGMGNKALYDLCLISLLGVLWLYGSERFYYGTVRNKEAAIPFIMAGSGSVWMFMQRDYYLS